MIPEQLEILITYRIGQSYETLKEAEILFEQSAFRGAVNRAYYAMFYAVLALLATRQVIVAEVKTDTSQLITAFGQACAYKLFAHRSYLVVPREAQPEDIGRLAALCTVFGDLLHYDPGHIKS